jgi:hypothetical protein
MERHTLLVTDSLTLSPQAGLLQVKKKMMKKLSLSLETSLHHHHHPHPLLTYASWLKVNYKIGGSHWVIESGCTQYMTGNPRMFTSLDENVDEQDKITFGDNSKGKVQVLGKVAISNYLSISNVLLVAPLSFNLLSMGQLCYLGLQCLFTPTEVVV